jgi:hypothetical protein
MEDFDFSGMETNNYISVHKPINNHVIEIYNNEENNDSGHLNEIGTIAENVILFEHEDNIM